MHSTTRDRSVLNEMAFVKMESGDICAAYEGTVFSIESRPDNKVLLSESEGDVILTLSAEQVKRLLPHR